MENGSQQITPRRKAAVLSTAGLLSVAVVCAAVGLGLAWRGEPFPVADPAVTARHLNERAVAAYDALALTGAPTLSREYSPGVEAHPEACRPRGISHFTDGLSDSPPLEPRTTAVAVAFAVAGVTHRQAVDGVQRARQALTAQGWTVGSYQEFDGYRLRLDPPDTAPGSVPYHVSVTYTDSTGYLDVGAYSECARYSGGTETDDQDRPPRLPELAVPARLRS